MKLTPTLAPASASRRLSDPVATVRTEMGRRGLRDPDLETVGVVRRSRRAADRLLGPRRTAGLGRGVS